MSEVTHPCFRCRLPDCDEESLGCERQKVIAAARRKRRNGEALNTEETVAFREYQREWRAAQRAQLKSAAACEGGC